MKRILYILLLLLPSSLSAQQALIDSLKPLLAQTTRTDTQYVDLLNQIAGAAMFIHPDTVAYYGQKVLDIGLESGNRKDEVSGYTHVGISHAMKAEYAQALFFFTKSLEISNEIQFKKGILASYVNILGVHSFNPIPYMTEELLEYTEKGIEMFESDGPSSGLAALYMARAWELEAMYDALTDQEKSSEEGIRLFKETEEANLTAQALFDSVGNPIQAMSAKNLNGLLYLHADSLELARKNTESAMPFFKEAGVWSEYIGNLTTMGIIYTELGEYEKVPAYFDEAAELLKTYDLLGQKHSLARYRSFYYREIGDYEAAYKYQLEWDSLLSELHASEQTSLMELNRLSYESEQRDQENQQLSQQNALIDSAQNLLIALLLLLLSGLGLGIVLMIRMNRQKQHLTSLNENQDLLFSIIAHDLRAPVNSLAELLRLFPHFIERGKHERLIKIAPQVKSSAFSLRMLLDNLLYWMRSQQEEVERKVEKLSLQELVQPSISIFEPQALRKAVEIQYDIPPNLAVTANRDEVQTVVRNLLSNALKYTEEGQISLQAEEKPQYISLHISDSGQGIPAEKIPQLFALDKRKSSSGTQGETGTGLGLAVCKQMLELNRGDISVKSKLGEGTTFSFHLPKA